MTVQGGRGRSQEACLDRLRLPEWSLIWFIQVGARGELFQLATLSRCARVLAPQPPATPQSTKRVMLMKVVHAAVRVFRYVFNFV